MGDIKIGNSSVTLKLGSTDVSAAYIGSTLVYSGGTPPTPSSPKWIATYSDSSTSSAACDSTSAITENEITKTNLISVEIGDCVTSIGDYAFYTCSLTSINIPSGVTSIGDGAFNNCRSLTSINIPSSVTIIGFGAFYRCSGLTSITVEATTPPTLGGTAFDNTNDCPILVPSGSLSAYQSAWSTYSSRIRPIPTTWTSIPQWYWLEGLSATAMRVSTAITLSESHNITFGDTSSNTYTLLYENGNWYNWRIMTNGSWTPDSKTLLTAVNGYYTIYFDSTYPCLGADGNEYGGGNYVNQAFDFEIS